MKHSVEEVKQFATLFYRTYYDKQFAQVLDLVDHRIVWSSFHLENCVAGKASLKKLLERKEQEQRESTFQIAEMELKVHSLDKLGYVVNANYWLKVSVQGEEKTSMPCYTSMLIDEHNLQVMFICFSVFGKEQTYTSEFVKSLKDMDVQEMRVALLEHAKQLDTTSREVKTLYNTVPGGIFKCLFDENLTLLETSDGFLNMIGYTRKEVHEQLKNSLRRLIEPTDYVATIEDVQKQLQTSSTKEIHYRLCHKDGHYIDVLDKGQLFIDEQDRQCFHCIVVDITREKRMEEELKLMLERYQIIMDQTNDIIFEWDMKKDRILFSNNWEKKFKQRYWKTEDTLVDILMSDASPFYPEDRDLLLDRLEEMQAGKQYVEEEIRIRNHAEIYLWCRIRMTAQYDEYHRPIKVIGVVVDIDQEKRRSMSLRKKAEQDALTGMYNKITTQELIQEYLQQEYYKNCALMIIDIDNFKLVNDTKGHLYGDAVLSDLSKTIRNSFRSTDIIGRIGGDEFMVFLKHTSSFEEIEKRASSMMKLIQKLRVANEQKIEISCSIGIAMAPKDGEDFTTLYQNADYALYQAKMQGKNQFTFYDEEKIHDYLKNQQLPYASTIGGKIDSDENNRLMNRQFEEYVFEILYHTENIKNAISTILEIIGIQFDVSRVYIFENSSDDLYCSNTFEWCNEGIEPQLDQLQNISYEKDLGGNYMENFNEERIFYCPDIELLPKDQYEVLEPQGIKSMLQCAITDSGVFRGYVGFDECRQNRYWTKEQINALVFTSEIISTFLLKRRAEEQLRLESESLLTMLDNQNSFIYVIDPKTNELLFINKATAKIAKNTSLGMTCHKAFMNLDEPCKNCPAALVNRKNPNNTVEFYNEQLDVWTDADASFITWKNREAILLSCHDITKYKK